MNDVSFLIISEDSPASFSPAGERARYLALACSSISRSVAVLTLRGEQSKDECGKWSQSSALLYSVNFSRGMLFPISAFFDPIRFLVFFVYGVVLCRRFKASHIVALMPPIETGASAFFLVKFLRRRLIVDLMDDWEAYLESNLTRYIPLFLLKQLFKIANMIYSSSIGILTVTSTIARAVNRRNVVVPTVLAPMGTSTSVFFPRGEKSRRKIRLRYSLPLNKIVIAYCGSGVAPYYRLDKILLAAKSLPIDAKRRIFLVFYLYSGVDHYKKLKDQLMIPDDIVQIRGPLARCDLSEVIGACDVGLLPFDDLQYLLCARSTKLYEYLSSGLYVVSSGPKGGELDLFFSKNPHCGIFIKPRVEKFSEAFIAVLDNCERLIKEDNRFARFSLIKKGYESKEVLKKNITRLLGFEICKHSERNDL